MSNSTPFDLCPIFKKVKFIKLDRGGTGVMLSKNQEEFAQNLASGHKNAEAYLLAYPRIKNKKTAAACASRLLKNANIRNRVLELKKESAKLSADSPETMRDFIIDKYKAIASGELCKVKEVRDGKGKLIRTEKSIDPSDVVGAIKALAEIYGIDLGQSNDNEIQIVLEAKMEDWTG